MNYFDYEKIHYKLDWFDKAFTITKCPHGVDCGVHSTYCQDHCKHFKNSDNNKQIVYCSYKFDNGLIFKHKFKKINI